MTIACIGWGSLVWQPGVLRCIGAWRTAGPVLPIEFARTSRDGRLTLVLTDGAQPVETLWVPLDYGTPEQAQEALAGREGAGLQAIGKWPGSAPAYAVGAAEIAEWAHALGVDAVVWTALTPKFGGIEGEVPTDSQTVVDYLRQLDDATTARAR